jgi:hypothetical protein
VNTVMNFLSSMKGQVSWAVVRPIVFHKGLCCVEVVGYSMFLIVKRRQSRVRLSYCAYACVFCLGNCVIDGS